MATVREALTEIDRRCDGAVTQDGGGFNGRDTNFAKTLLTKTTWTYKMEVAAYKLLKKYHKQLAAYGIPYETIVEPVEKGNEPQERKLELDWDGRDFVIHSSYSEKDFVKDIAAPGRRWNPETKVWTFAPSNQFMQEMLIKKESFTQLTVEARNMLNHLYVNFIEPQESEANAPGALISPSVLQSYVRTTLYDYQMSAAQAAVSLQNYALFPEQRVGKTYPTISAIGYRTDHDQVKRILVVAPKTVTYEWQDKLKEEATFPVDITLLSEDSLADRKTYLSRNKDHAKAEVILLNYDALYRMQAELVAWKPEMVILDEAHHIKGGRSQQSKAAYAIGRKAKFKMILTGTPITQGPLDIWAQYRFLDDTIFGRSYVKFRDRYAVMGGWMGKEIVGYKTIPEVKGKPNRYYDQELSEEFTKKVYSVATRLTFQEAKEHLGMEYLEPEVEYIPVRLEDSARALYNRMDDEAFLDLGGERVTATIVLTKMLRLQQICGGFIKPDDSDTYQQFSTAKLDALEQVILRPGKMVIFAKFIPEIVAIAKLAEKHHIKHHVLTGKTKNRGFIRRDFQENPETKLFISQIGTGGEGITLSSADIAIFFSTGTSLREFDQAKSRVSNMTKDRRLRYIHIVAEATRDMQIVKILDSKQDIATMSVDKLRKLMMKEANPMKLPKEVERVMEQKPAGGESFDAEINRLLEGIEEDLNRYEKQSKRPVKSLDEILEETRGTKRRHRSDRTTGEKGSVNREGITTLQDLGKELEMDPKEMRKVLRGQFEKPEGGRWEWKTGSKELDKVRKALAGS